MTPRPSSHLPARTRPGWASRLGKGLLSAIVGASLSATFASQAAAESRTNSGKNGDGMDLHLFRPAIDSKGLFSVNGADILGANDISLGLVLDYGRHLMELKENASGTEFLVEHALQGTFQFDYGIANFLVVGVAVPFVLNGGDEVQDIGPTGSTYTDDELSTGALGNLAFHAKLRLLRPERDFIGLALIGQAGFGAGGTQDFASDPGFFFWPQVVLEKRFGYTGPFRIAINGGFRGHTGSNPEFGKKPNGVDQLKSGDFKYSNLFTGGVGMSLRVLASLDVVAETYSTYQAGGGDSSKQKFSAEALGGIKLFIERNSYFMIGAGLGYTPGFQAAEQRATLGIVFEPSIGDRDGDGIKDDEDNCPDQPEDFDGFQDTKADSPPGKYGCPDPDNDNDGILDVDDRCPNNPEDRDGVEDDDGCPEGNDGDRDGDGILDSRDKCPDDPEDRDGFEDKDGCPDPDNDKDGIPDTADRCPNDPEDKDGFQDEDGCPDPDNDGDGIPDAKDKCPNEKETFNGFEDEDGCPDKGKVIIEENNILILEKINFETGSSKILPESFGIVEAVATTLTHHPEFTLIEVQGHADERSDDKYNLRLTQERANAVVEALISKGVDRNKLRSMGYGEYCPLNPAHNAPAWEKNRRVEFKVVKSDKGPTNVELGCATARTKGVVSPAVMDPQAMRASGVRALSRGALAAVLAAAAGGCVNTDAAVFVGAAIASPSAAVQAGALGTDLAGSFQLDLHLGPRASGSSRVSVQTFTIKSADQLTSIVDPLEVTTGTTLPVEVAPDSDVAVDFAFDSRTEGTPLPKEAQAALCAPDGIRIAGAIDDSLQDGATPVVSEVFHTAGCM